jgi:dTDP-N-acetylfucosamine:lipid II N-acetylfucosaminyltransferase
MILHLVDDEKFTDYTIDLFEQVDPGNHLYIWICDDISFDFKYIKRRERVLVLKKHSGEYSKYLSDLSVYDALIVYSFFNVNHLDLVLQAPADVKIVWFFGGGELFSVGIDKTPILLPLTKGLYYKNKIVPWLKINIQKYTGLLKRGEMKTIVKPLIGSKPIRTRSGIAAEKIRRAICRADYIAPVLEEEFHTLKRLVPCRGEIVEFHYPPPVSFYDVKYRKSTGDNWLVGNSSRYANNHIELFRILRKIRGHQGKVIVPLSYGSDSYYRDDVIRYGQKWFGERFVPLVDFMSFAQYLDLLCTCSCAFMNFRRQHAIGNILMLLYLGVKVYLRQENPVYQFLKRRQAVVFSLSADWPRRAGQVAIPLDPNAIEINRSIAASIIEKDVFEAKARKLITLIKTIK